MAQANSRKEKTKWKYIAVTIGIVSFLLFVASTVLITIGCLNPYGPIGLGILGGGTVLFLATEAFLCMSCIWVKNNYSEDEIDFAKKQVGTSTEDVSLLKPAANNTTSAALVLKPRDETDAPKAEYQSVFLHSETSSGKTSTSSSPVSNVLESQMSPDWSKRKGEQQYLEMKNPENITQKTVGKSKISKATKLFDKTDSQVVVTSKRTAIGNPMAASKPKQSKCDMDVKPKPTYVRILMGDREAKTNSSAALPVEKSPQFVTKYNKPLEKVQHLNPVGDSSTTGKVSREYKKTLHDARSDLHAEKKHWAHHKQDRAEIQLQYVSSQNHTPDHS